MVKPGRRSSAVPVLLGRPLKLRNLGVLAPDRMNTLSRAHIEIIGPDIVSSPMI